MFLVKTSPAFGWRRSHEKTKTVLFVQPCVSYFSFVFYGFFICSSSFSFFLVGQIGPSRTGHSSTKHPKLAKVGLAKVGIGQSRSRPTLGAVLQVLGHATDKFRSFNPLFCVLNVVDVSPSSSDTSSFTLTVQCP